MATAIVRAFAPRAGREADSGTACAPGGAWAERFARSVDFHGAERLKARGRYPTLDR